MTSTCRAIRFGHTLIPFGIAESPRRETIAITVRPDLSVRVATPCDAPTRLVDRAVLSKAEWIIEQWEIRRRMSSPVPRQFRSGESIRYLGRGYRLRVRVGHKRSLRLIGGVFEATVPSCETPKESFDQLEWMFKSWFRDRGTVYLTPLVNYYGGLLGVETPPLRLVTMKSRWGSCSAHSIRMHWQIMMAPRRLVRYVVAHEVCHLKHANHSRAFWRSLERLMPDCHARHTELSAIGPRLSL